MEIDKENIVVTPDGKIGGLLGKDVLQKNHVVFFVDGDVRSLPRGKLKKANAPLRIKVRDADEAELVVKKAEKVGFEWPFNYYYDEGTESIALNTDMTADLSKGYDLTFSDYDQWTAWLDYHSEDGSDDCPGDDAFFEQSENIEFESWEDHIYGVEEGVLNHMTNDRTDSAENAQTDSYGYENDCDNCGGQGWVTDGGGTAYACPECSEANSDECDPCNGTGKAGDPIQGGSRECEQCGGTGKINMGYFYASSGDTVFLDCPDCSEDEGYSEPRPDLKEYREAIRPYYTNETGSNYEPVESELEEARAARKKLDKIKNILSEGGEQYE